MPYSKMEILNSSELSELWVVRYSRGIKNCGNMNWVVETQTYKNRMKTTANDQALWQRCQFLLTETLRMTEKKKLCFCIDLYELAMQHINRNTLHYIHVQKQYNHQTEAFIFIELALVIYQNQSAEKDLNKFISSGKLPACLG